MPAAGLPDASITKEAVDGFLYGPHLRSCTVRRNELALRQLADHARAVGWDAYIPAATTRVRVRHQPPYVLTDDEVRRLFAAIDSQPMSCYSNKALVEPVYTRFRGYLADAGIPHFIGGPHPHSQIIGDEAGGRVHHGHVSPTPPLVGPKTRKARDPGAKADRTCPSAPSSTHDRPIGPA